MKSQSKVKRLSGGAHWLLRLIDVIYSDLLIVAGLLTLIFAPLTFPQLRAPLAWNPLYLAFLVACVVGDLIRLRFIDKKTVSLGFIVVFGTLLIDYPHNSLLWVLFVAILGTGASEILYSRFFSKQKRPGGLTLVRAGLYAGHHAVAILAALVIYQVIRYRFNPWFGLEMTHLQATLAFVLVYSLLSMLLVWPHDVRIRLFLSFDEEPLVRVALLQTLVLLPVPAVGFYLFNQVESPLKPVLVVGLFAPLFLLLFLVARYLNKTEEDRDRLARSQEINQRLGSPANMDELVEQMLLVMNDLVEYRWGAVYSVTDGTMRLCGEKSHKGSVIFHFSLESAENVTDNLPQDQRQVHWPRQIELGQGLFDQLVTAYPPSRFFYDGWKADLSIDPYLPAQTALIAFPISVGGQGEQLAAGALCGLVVLARPKRRFTTWDWESGQALSDQVGNLLMIVQRLETQIRDLYRQVESYTKDPEKVRQAMSELIQTGVDVSKILAYVSESSFHDNLQAVLRGVVDGRRSGEISLAQEMLTEIYGRVRDETPGMPPLTPELLRLLQTVTSSLSLAFSFRYQFPDVVRGPAFQDFYKFLLIALDANTVSRIVQLYDQIQETVWAVHEREAGLQQQEDTARLPRAALEEVQKLQSIIEQLKLSSTSQDLAVQTAALSRAMELLAEQEKAARERLRDPERFVFLQILAGWRTAIANALNDLAGGPAQLNVQLSTSQALPLDKVTVALVIKNTGRGAAYNVVARLEPAPDYELLEEERDLGVLVSGRALVAEFILHPKGSGPLRLSFLVKYNDAERKGKVTPFADLLHLREPLVRFQTIVNSYTPGLPLKPGNPTFVGRDDIFEFIHQSIPNLMQKMVLVLIGERRAGKTSILKQLNVRLNDSRYIPIYLDCQALGIDPGMDNFFLSLATAIMDGVKELGVVIPCLALSDLKDNPRHVFERQFLPAVRDKVGGRVLLFTIDEFEELGDRVKRERLPPEVFSYLRHLVQHEEGVAFIFAGTHKMEDLMGDYWSLLFNIAKYKRIGFLRREETVRLITEPVKPYGMVYDDLAIGEMIRLTACHPYFTQLLCNILVNRCNEAEINYVTIQDVRDAVDELLETGRAHLTFLWQTANSGEQLVLAALAELRDQSDTVNAAAVASRLGNYKVALTAGQITKAMTRLVARDIAREIPGNPVAYDFTAQLYAHWIRLYWPLSKVVEEVGDATSVP